MRAPPSPVRRASSGARAARAAGSRAASARRRAASCPVFAPSSLKILCARQELHRDAAAPAAAPETRPGPRTHPRVARRRPPTERPPATPPRAPHLQRPWCVDAVHSHITTASKDVPAYSRRKQRAALRDYCESGGLEKGVLSAQGRSRRCRVWPAGQCQAAKTLCDRSYLAHPHR